MTFNRKIACGVGLIASSACCILTTGSAQAACTSNTGGAIPDNNCVTYDNVSAPTVATLYYNDINLANNYWQLTSTSTQIANFSNWEYSRNGSSYTSFDPGFTGATISAGTVFTTTTSPSAPAGNPFYIRVTLSSTVPTGSQYSFALRTNNNNAVDSSGRLDDLGNNNASILSRNFTRQADPPSNVPGPLPLLGAAAAFRYSRKMRKAIKAHN